MSLGINFVNVKIIKTMKKEKIYKQYKLLKDTPKNKAGKFVYFNVINNSENSSCDMCFCFHVDIYPDYKGEKFAIKEVQNTEWFEPIGKPFDLIPKFPNIKEIEEYMYLLGETRLVNSVDFVRAVETIFYSEKFKKAVYELLKTEYNNKYFKNK